MLVCTCLLTTALERWRKEDLEFEKKLEHGEFKVSLGYLT